MALDRLPSPGVLCAPQHMGGRRVFFLVGPTVVKGPTPRVPPILKTPRIWPAIFLECPKFTYKNEIK